MGGNGGDERDKQEVTLNIKPPLTESKQQYHSVYSLACVKIFFSELNNLRKVTNYTSLKVTYYQQLGLVAGSSVEIKQHNLIVFFKPFSNKG